MTIDQILFLLCDRSHLLHREVEMEPMKAVGSITPDKDGMIRGIAADGTPMKARIGGKSKARQLMEEHAKKVTEEAAARKKKRGRRRG